ncbi:hypothetical protein F383_32982 [Gossypium arboreum]|uniref:Uncharacterized protein n=1 Tax=Gossypium arboreum TaxID=29729 RepID=A0A0B0N0X0_GOSAR|nr:hypothetical protein F383_32982 [Gossypium arboreum]
MAYLAFESLLCVCFQLFYRLSRLLEARGSSRIITTLSNLF